MARQALPKTQYTLLNGKTVMIPNRDVDAVLAYLKINKGHTVQQIAASTLINPERIKDILEAVPNAIKIVKAYGVGVSPFAFRGGFGAAAWTRHCKDTSKLPISTSGRALIVTDAALEGCEAYIQADFNAKKALLTQALSGSGRTPRSQKRYIDQAMALEVTTAIREQEVVESLAVHSEELAAAHVSIAELTQKVDALYTLIPQAQIRRFPDNDGNDLVA